ncbi:hypothetical protein ABIB06_006594 [Bradyrhizobium sp. LB8.2]|uniref:hypothetical protein n=1 Tax=unclassified Bradyrhizobium TaxID=2631580 RepID=UPI00339594F7
MFWSYEHAVLVDEDDPDTNLEKLLQCAAYAGKAGWDWERWDGSIIHFRFSDFDEAAYFDLINNGVYY